MKGFNENIIRKDRLVFRFILAFLFVISGIGVFAEDRIAADTQFNGNLALTMNGEYAIAQKGWEEFLRKFPENSQRPHAEHYLAICRCHTKEYAGAEALFQKVLADGKFPFRDETVYLLGVAYLEHAGTFPLQKTGSRLGTVNTVGDRSYAISQDAAALCRQAVTQFQQLRNDFPDSKFRMDATFYEALAFIQLGNYENALGDLKLVVATRNFADLNRALYTLSEVYLNLPQPDEKDALITLQTLLEADPEPALKLRATRLLADIYFRLGNYEAAAERFRTILGEGTEKSEFAAWLNPEKEEPGVLNLAFLYYRYGETLAKLGSYAEAAEVFSRVPAAFPENPVAIYARYQQALAMKKFNENLPEGASAFDLAECAALWQQILEDPKVKKDRSLRNSASHQLVLYCLKTGDAERALKTVDRISKKSRTTTLLRDRADALKAIGRSDEAIAIYRQLFRTLQSPKNLTQGADAMLQAIWALAAKNDFQSVLQATDEVIVWDGFGRLPEVMQMTFLEENANALYRLQNYGSAREGWERLLKRFPKSVNHDSWLVSIAYCFQKNGASREGYRFILKELKSVSGAGEQVELRHLLGVCYRDYAQTKTSSKLIEKYLNRSQVQLIKAKNAARKMEYAHLDVLYYDLSLVYFLQKKYEKCVQNIGFGLKNCPDSPLADQLFFLKGRCEVEMGSLDRAAATFESFLEKFPQSVSCPEAGLLASQCYLKLNRTEKAVQLAKELATRFPNSRFQERGANVQAIAAMEASDFDAAIEAWNVILKSDSEEFRPLHPEAKYEIGCCLLEKKEFAQAEKTFRELLEQFPDWDSHERVFNQLVKSLLEQKKLQEAQDSLAEMNGKFPQSIFLRSLYYQLGTLWFADGRMEEAGAAFQSVLNEPRDSRAKPDSGKEAKPDSGKGAKSDSGKEAKSDSQKKSDSGKKTKKVRTGKKSKSSAPKESSETVSTASAPVGDFFQRSAEVKVAWTLFNQNQFRETASFIESLNLTPSIPESVSEEEKAEILANRAELRFLMGMTSYFLGNPSKALKELKEVRKDPALSRVFSENALEMILQIYEETEKWESVLETGANFLEVYPDSANRVRVEFKRAMASFRLKRLEDALAQCEPLLEANDPILTPQTLFLKGEILFAQKQYEQAIQMFYQVIYGVEEPQLQANALFEAAQCFEMLGKTDKALSHYHDLLEKFPKSDKVKLARRKMKKLQ